MASTLLEDQAKLVIAALEGRQLERDSLEFKKALDWIDKWPTSLEASLRRKLIESLCKTCNVTEAEIFRTLAGLNGFRPQSGGREERFRSLLPKEGWFQWYDTYTRFNESPITYHIFSSLCILGAALGRRVSLDMGHFDLYPNYCVLLVGPTGYVHKSSAADIAKAIIEKATLCPILADKITPEKLVNQLVKYGGHQFIYAPELSVMFGKQQYNEGFASQMLRLLDSPATYTVATMSRDEETVTNLALSVLGGTTPSLLAGSTPKEVISSGFLNRFVLVNESDTERCFPVPSRGQGVEEKILIQATRLKSFSGKMSFTVEGRAWYDSWYRSRFKLLREVNDDSHIEVMARAPMHVLRTAMLVHLVQCDNLQMCEACIKVATGLIEFVEKSVPQIISATKQTSERSDSDTTLQALVKLKGGADHSTLLRRLVSKGVNSTMMKSHIKSLEESGRIKVGKKPGGSAMYYTVVEDGE